MSTLSRRRRRSYGPRLFAQRGEPGRCRLGLEPPPSQKSFRRSRFPGTEPPWSRAASAPVLRGDPLGGVLYGPVRAKAVNMSQARRFFLGSSTCLFEEVRDHHDAAGIACVSSKGEATSGASRTSWPTLARILLQSDPLGLSPPSPAHTRNVHTRGLRQNRYALMGDPRVG